MTSHDILDKSFLRRLAEEYTDIRDGEVAKRLAQALPFPGEGTDEYAEVKLRYLYAALEFAPREISLALYRIMLGAHISLADRAKAARLYLHGDAEGWWKATPSDAERARDLIIAQYGNVELKMQEPTVETKSKSGRAAKVGADYQKLSAIGRECSILTATLKNPDVSAKDRLDAIQKWFVAMDYLAPEEMRTPLVLTPEQLRELKEIVQ